MPKPFTENLRFLVWQRAADNRDEWPRQAAALVGCDPARGRELLWEVGKPAEIAEMESLADRCELVLDEVASRRLFEPEQILANNIAYLFDGLDHGAKGTYARAIGVDVSTISRWRRCVAKPSRAHLTKLAEQFALDRGTDLESEPLFLSLTPVSLAQRRSWLKRQIDRITPQEMNDLFPALRLLLGGDRAAD